MIIDMFEWHKMLNDKKINLVYSGPIWSEGISELAKTLKKHLELDEVPLNIVQEVYSVFVEQINNVLMYSAEKTHLETENSENTAFPKGTFVIGKEEDSFFIQSGNIMRKDNMDLVKSRIDYLNTLDKNEIRQYYKEKMKLDDNNPDSKGAGLGFIEIARRVNSKLKYSFIDINNELVFFTLYVTIGGKENDV